MAAWCFGPFCLVIRGQGDRWTIAPEQTEAGPDIQRIGVQERRLEQIRAAGASLVQEVAKQLGFIKEGVRPSGERSQRQSQGADVQSPRWALLLFPG
jgi:hypothetical protein